LALLSSCTPADAADAVPRSWATSKEHTEKVAKKRIIASLADHRTSSQKNLADIESAASSTRISPVSTERPLISRRPEPRRVTHSRQRRVVPGALNKLVLIVVRGLWWSRHGHTTDEHPTSNASHVPLGRRTSFGRNLRLYSIDRHPLRNSRGRLREPPLASRGEERQDVERPQRTGPLRWVVVAVDCGEGFGQGIHIGNGEEPAPNVVGPFLDRKRIVEQYLGIARGVCWPTLRLMPVTMESRRQVQPCGCRRL
jgi:hypothetical protein